MYRSKDNDICMAFHPLYSIFFIDEIDLDLDRNLSFVTDGFTHRFRAVFGDLSRARENHVVRQIANESYKYSQSEM